MPLTTTVSIKYRQKAASFHNSLYAGPHPRTVVTFSALKKGREPWAQQPVHTGNKAHMELGISTR